MKVPLYRESTICYYSNFSTEPALTLDPLPTVPNPRPSNLNHTKLPELIRGCYVPVLATNPQRANPPTTASTTSKEPPPPTTKLKLIDP